MSTFPCAPGSWNKTENVPTAALFDLSFKVRGPPLLMLHKPQSVTFTL